MGWQCPNCLVVYAPSVQKCECSVNPNQKIPLPKDYVSFNDITIDKDFGAYIWQNTPIPNKYSCALFMGKTTDGLCSKCGQPAWNHHNISST